MRRALTLVSLCALIASGVAVQGCDGDCWLGICCDDEGSPGTWDGYGSDTGYDGDVPYPGDGGDGCWICGGGGEVCCGGGAWCSTDGDCSGGEACSPTQGVCVPTVLGCPLTEECLGDPAGHVDEDFSGSAWQGTDPVFAGTLTGEGLSAQVEVDLDFYDDHLFGEGVASYVADEGWQEWVSVYVTGTRSGTSLAGQVIEQDGRRFDATFTAELIEASEIVGTVTISSEEGVVTASFHLVRTSPCGCEVAPAGCTTDGDCGGLLCVRGECVECVRSADCAAGQACVDGACAAEAEPECETTCDCGLGLVCEDGVCVEDGRPEPYCLTDCDCDYGAGETCVDGVCVPPVE